MMTNPYKFDSIRYSTTVPNHVLNALEKFRDDLEKTYFSNILIRVTKNTDTFIEIAIEIQSKFWLSEGIQHYNNPLLQELKYNTSKLEQFYALYKKLKQNATINIDISELSIYLIDTALIISKVSENSIINQLDNILSSVIKNVDNIMSQDLGYPTEIYMPLFYESSLNTTKSIIDDEKSYFRFWGLYYDSQEDAVIYNVNSNTAYKGDLLITDHIEIMENLQVDFPL